MIIQGFASDVLCHAFYRKTEMHRISPLIEFTERGSQRQGRHSGLFFILVPVIAVALLGSHLGGDFAVGFGIDGEEVCLGSHAAKIT